jgi:hypothetical protein
MYHMAAEIFPTSYLMYEMTAETLPVSLNTVFLPVV